MLGCLILLHISAVDGGLHHVSSARARPTCNTIGRGGGLVWAFLGLIWSVWALSEWCGTAADLISPVVAPGFVICRAGDRCEHACELGQGAALNVPIDLEGSGKWGLGGNEGVAPSFPKLGGLMGWD